MISWADRIRANAILESSYFGDSTGNDFIAFLAPVPSWWPEKLTVEFVTVAGRSFPMAWRTGQCLPRALFTHAPDMNIASPARFNCLDHPLRPPAWRWLRASYLADNGKKPSRERGAAGVRAAVRFCRALRHSDTAAREKLRRRMSALYAAYQFFSGRPTLRRWELGARLLASASSALP
jgi:hypothetical protein